MNQIHPSKVYSALISGARRIESNQYQLNLANGFPVPDQDTGSNLAYLFAAIRRQLPTKDNIKDLLASLSDIALRRARGNSGAIFSQFFNGCYQASKPLGDVLVYEDLAGMFEEGYFHALRGVKVPCEGTILTAMNSFRNSFAAAIQGMVTEPFTPALVSLRKTVEETKDLLPQQKAIQQPDAGALAFLYFVEGMVDSIVKGADVKEEVVMEGFYEEIPHLLLDKEVIENRYCTEVLLEKKTSETLQEAVHALLENRGDSQVVSETDQLLRVHVHSNEPALVVDELAEFGEILEVKADDMRYQQLLSQEYPGKTALIIDSIADIPMELLGEHVYRLPMNLLEDGVSFQDKRTMSHARLLRNASKITSSQLNLAEVSEFLDPISKSYDELLIITVSSKMSGLYDRYLEYKKAHPDKNIALVDSRLNSGAQGLLSLKAIEMLHSGKSLDEITDALENLRERTKIFVCVPNLKGMVTSGRLNKRIGKLLQTLRFLPLITINPEGEGTITGLTFSQSANEELLLKKLKVTEIEEYVLVYSGDSTRVNRVVKKITDIIGKEPRYITDISSIVSLFSGEGSYAIGYLEKEVDK